MYRTAAETFFDGRAVMNNLYEYIDPILSSYEAFCCDSSTSRLPIPAHWHYYVELLYIIEGNARVTIDHAVEACPPGSVVLFPPRCVHAIGFTDRKERLRYHVVKFDPEILPHGQKDGVDLRAFLKSVTTAACPCCFSPARAAEMNLRPLFEEIVREYEQKDYAYSVVISADLGRIMAGFVRCWQRSGCLPAAPDIPPSYELRFDLIAEYIDRHYSEELTVEKLAAMCGMSHATFSMHFRRRYGMTCREYINATRINVAENMLLFSSHDVAFIAQEVGYADCSYFIRCYKKLKGMTPKQARKAGR